MKLLHFVEMRVFCKEYDIFDDIVKGIHFLFPFDFVKEKIILGEKTVEGFDQKKIKIFTVKISKQSQTTAFIKHLSKNLDDKQRKTIIEQLDSRLDEGLHFYIRLEKDELISGKYYLTDTGNCYHIKLSIAAYPHRKEAARDIIKSIF